MPIHRNYWNIENAPLYPCVCGSTDLAGDYDDNWGAEDPTYCVRCNDCGREVGWMVHPTLTIDYWNRTMVAKVWEEYPDECAAAERAWKKRFGGQHMRYDNSTVRDFIGG